MNIYSVEIIFFTCSIQKIALIIHQVGKFIKGINQVKKIIIHNEKIIFHIFFIKNFSISFLFLIFKAGELFSLSFCHQKYQKCLRVRTFAENCFRFYLPYHGEISPLRIPLIHIEKVIFKVFLIIIIYLFLFLKTLR